MTARWPHYRVRTWLRKTAPWVVAERIPKGRRDCGRHAFYNSDDSVERCYHCKVGERPLERARSAASSTAAA